MAGRLTVYFHQQSEDVNISIPMWLKDRLRRWLALVFDRRLDLVLRKDLATPPGIASPARIEVIPIRIEHRDSLIQFIHRYHVDVAKSLRMLDDCLRQGYEGRLALLNGQIIGYRWWATHIMNHPQLTMYRVTLGANEVFAFGLYIARPFRAQGFATEFLAITQRQLVDLGYRHLYNAIAADNTPARRLNETFGSREFARHTVVKLFSSLIFCAGQWLRYNPVWM